MLARPAPDACTEHGGCLHGLSPDNEGEKRTFRSVRSFRLHSLCRILERPVVKTGIHHGPYLYLSPPDSFRLWRDGGERKEAPVTAGGNLTEKYPRQSVVFSSLFIGSEGSFRFPPSASASGRGPVSACLLAERVAHPQRVDILGRATALRLHARWFPSGTDEQRHSTSTDVARIRHPKQPELIP